jgi:seryl-tRNA synthetase
MIDIRELRRDPEAYLAKLARKGAGELGQELLDLDAAWRATTTSAESLRAKLKSSGKPTAEQREELQRTKEQFQETESKLAELEARRRALLDRLPNPPADDVPSGGEEDFEVLREMGTKPSFAFTARDHLDLAQPHGWLDAPRGTKA